MAKVIAFPDGATFDFEKEALEAAINEACEGNSLCTMEAPCMYCQALAYSVKARLVRAYLAGQASMTKTEGGNE